MKRFLLTLVTLLLVNQGQSLAQSVPSLINYQGRLSDSEGQPVTGQRDITFSFYNYPATGTPVWAETQSVQVQNGRFNVLLGSVNPVTAAVFSSPEVYLGVKVGTDAEMSPRSRMASVGYAFKAADAETVNGLRANEISAESEVTAFAGYAASNTCTLVTSIPSGKRAIFTHLHVPSSYVMYLYTNSSCTARRAVVRGDQSSGVQIQGPASVYVKCTNVCSASGEIR